MRPLAAAEERLMLAVDVSSWLRPGAETSPDRLFCHAYGCGKGQAQMIPGLALLRDRGAGASRTSWTAVLDAVRLGPDDDETAVTATQVRDVLTRLIASGWCWPSPLASRRYLRAAIRAYIRVITAARPDVLFTDIDPVTLGLSAGRHRPRPPRYPLHRAPHR